VSVTANMQRLMALGFQSCITAKNRDLVVLLILCALFFWPQHSIDIAKYNREPLWPSNYTNTTSYQLMTTLNQVFRSEHPADSV
jgi:hypothetical protein